MLQQLNPQEAEDSSARKSNACPVSSLRGAVDGGGGKLCQGSNLLHLRQPEGTQTELRFRRMLDLWITFRHTLQACGRK